MLNSNFRSTGLVCELVGEMCGKGNDELLSLGPCNVMAGAQYMEGDNEDGVPLVQLCWGPTGLVMLLRY